MELYIDENGKARDIDECSVNIVCESKEEADKMMKGLADGRLVMVEWHPVKTRPLTDEELRYYYDTYGSDSIPGYMLDCPLPEDDQMILIVYPLKTANKIEMTVAVDTCVCDEYGYYLEDFDSFDNIVAWAELPKPYKEGT